MNSRTCQSCTHRASARLCKASRQGYHPLLPPTSTSHSQQDGDYQEQCLQLEALHQPRRAALQEASTEEGEQFERMQEALSQNGSPGGGRAKWKCRQKEPKRGTSQWGHHSAQKTNALSSGKKASSSPGRRNQSKMKRNLRKKKINALKIQTHASERSSGNFEMVTVCSAIGNIGLEEAGWGSLTVHVTVTCCVALVLDYSSPFVK